MEALSDTSCNIMSALAARKWKKTCENSHCPLTELRNKASSLEADASEYIWSFPLVPEPFRSPTRK